MKRLIRLEKKRLRNREHRRLDDVILGGLEGKEEAMSNSERGRWVVVEKRKDIFEVLAMHWGGLGNVSLSEEDVPIDNLKSKAKEVNWMMELVRFQEMFTIVKGLKREMAPSPDGIINEMLKYGGNRMVKILCYLVNLVVESRYWPGRRSYIVLL